MDRHGGVNSKTNASSSRAGPAIYEATVAAREVEAAQAAAAALSRESTLSSVSPSREAEGAAPGCSAYGGANDNNLSSPSDGEAKSLGVPSGPPLSTERSPRTNE